MLCDAQVSTTTLFEMAVCQSNTVRKVRIFYLLGYFFHQAFIMFPCFYSLLKKDLWYDMILSDMLGNLTLNITGNKLRLFVYMHSIHETLYLRLNRLNHIKYLFYLFIYHGLVLVEINERDMIVN